MCSKRVANLMISGLANLLISVACYMQSPFFPAVAESKGASATEYSFVFGANSLSCGIAALMVGDILKPANSRLMMIGGAAFIATATIAFGYLDMIESRWLFVTLAISFRILMGVANSGYYAASYSRVIDDFPDTKATAVAVMEGCYGLGHVVGPSLGSIMFLAGGFIVPYKACGLSLLLVIIVMIFITRKSKSDQKASDDSSSKTLEAQDDKTTTVFEKNQQFMINELMNKTEQTVEGTNSITKSNGVVANGNKPISSNGLKQNGEITVVSKPKLLNATSTNVLRSFDVVFGLLVIMTGTLGFGFICGAVEPYFRDQIGSDTRTTGLLFLISGVTFIISTTVCGYLCDKIMSSRTVSMFSILVNICALLCLGPPEFTNTELTFELACVGMALNGIGVAGQCLAGFNYALDGAIKYGFAPNSALYGVTSALFISTATFGEFIGPLVGGALIDISSFRTALLFPLIILVVMNVVLVIFGCVKRYRKTRQLGSEQGTEQSR